MNKIGLLLSVALLAGFVAAPMASAHYSDDVVGYCVELWIGNGNHVHDPHQPQCEDDTTRLVDRAQVDRAQVALI